MNTENRTFTFPFFKNEEGQPVIHLHDEDVLLDEIDWDAVLLTTAKDWIAGLYHFKHSLDYTTFVVEVTAQNNDLPKLTPETKGIALVPYVISWLNQARDEFCKAGEPDLELVQIHLSNAINALLDVTKEK